jgi:prolipoprotein diacylglyceryl transferase
VIASIPSPHSGTLDLGPLTIHMYGLTLLVAIAACILLTGYRWTRRGGDWDLILKVAVWGVAAGIVGARAYHDITSWNEVSNPKWKGVFAVWQGGLGVWGGILVGCLVGAYIAHREGVRVRELMDAVAPGLLLAQGIGRFGNWWNQELYGKATDLPWGLEIDRDGVTGTYHPTFLYEMLWDFLAAALLVFVIERRFRPRPPGVFAAYITLYCAGRFVVEQLRIDPAHEIAGMRVNGWVALAGVVGGALWLWLSQRRRKPKAPPKPPTMAVPRGRVRPGG